MKTQTLTVEYDREADGRWIAEIPSVPGAMAYGATKAQARRQASAIALRTLADQVESGRSPRVLAHFFSHGTVAHG